MAGAFVSERGFALNKTAEATTVVTTSSGPIAVGNKLTVSIARDAQAISSITDSRGNTYVQAVERAGTNIRTCVWYTDVATAIQSGDTITVTWAANETAKAIRLVEYSGLATGAPSSTNNGAGSVAATSAGAVTVPASGLAIAACGWEGPASDSAGAVGGWTARSEVGTSGGSATSNVTIQVADTTSSGSQTYNPTLSTARNWADVAAAWGPSSGSASGTVVTTGGGVVTSAIAGDHAGAPTITGAGVVVPAIAGTHAGAPIVTGGGVVTLVGGAGGEVHSGTVTTTGGGVVASTSSSSHAKVATTTGGGVVTLDGGELLEEHSGTVNVSGHGRVSFTIYGEGAVTLSGCEIAGVLWDVQGDVGELSFILDRDHLDDDPGSRLYPQDEADQTSLASMLLGAVWRWGAGQPLGPLTVESAGSATISLVDTERKLDETNPDSPWALTFRLGLQLRILADGSPAFTGAVESWAHDVGTATSTITLVDALAEAAAVPMAEAIVGLPAAPMSVTARDLAESAIDSAGWPNSRREYLDTATVVHSSADPTPTIPLGGSLLDWLQQLAYLELATLSASRAGKLRWRSNLGAQAIPAPTAIVNCGGVLLSSLEARQALWRVRNRVRITGTPGSGEWFGDSITYGPDEVGASQLARVVTTDVDSLPVGAAGWPTGRDAVSSSFIMGNVGTIAQAATAYELQLWRADTRATVWTSSGAIAIPYGTSLGVAYAGPALVAGVPYEWRYRLTLSGGGTTQWLGMRFTTGTRPQSSPTSYREWADRVLDELADPLPVIELGTMAPRGAEVVPIICAERGDRWIVAHDHVSPPITATVRVLGMSCSLTATGIEADAVTETEAIA